MASRRDFITSQDIRNIERKAIVPAYQFHTDDAQSVDCLVCHLKKEEHDPILFYKSYGTSCDDAFDIASDSFVLIIQTLHQKNMFEKFASRILCIDSTHGTNQYGYKLITVMVVDDVGNGKLQHVTGKQNSES